MSSSVVPVYSGKLPNSVVPVHGNTANAVATIHSPDRFLAPRTNETGKFTDGITRHHRKIFDDYTFAKIMIMEALGDISEIDLFGRQVLCAVFCRPNITPGGIYQTSKEIREDWYQHKVTLIIKAGPEAFTGDQSYLDATFGNAPLPRPGEWVFANANAGMQINLAGEGAHRPQGADFHGDPIDIFEWDGWPCRIMADDNILGRLSSPHSII